jgi:ATP-dependent Lhr-like helicase
MLRQKLPADTLFWINAQDPASICGLGIDALKDELPRRLVGTHLVYLGSRLAMVSRRHGKILDVRLPEGHPRLPDCFDLFAHLFNRPISPRRSITVETINGKAAAESPLAEVLSQRFDILVETGSITVYRRMGA